MSDLLERLAQRPAKPCRDRAEDWLYGDAEWHQAMQARAEFDRDLLLDAVEHYFAQYEQPATYSERAIDTQNALLTEAEDALRTIVATLKSSP